MAEEAVDFYHRCYGLGTVILRFSHTQDATELLDPNSFFSGPRFYLKAKIRQQRDFGNIAVVGALESLDTGKNKLVVSCSEDGRPYRMGICDTRDTVKGARRSGPRHHTVRDRVQVLHHHRDPRQRDHLARLVPRTGAGYERNRAALHGHHGKSVRGNHLRDPLP